MTAEGMRHVSVRRDAYWAAVAGKAVVLDDSGIAVGDTVVLRIVEDGGGVTFTGEAFRVGEKRTFGFPEGMCAVVLVPWKGQVSGG